MDFVSPIPVNMRGYENVWGEYVTGAIYKQICTNDHGNKDNREYKGK